MDTNLIGESYNTALQNISSQMGISLNLLVTLMSVVALWTLLWKGLALWKASQKNQKLIFVILLVLNDFGIIELVYFFFLSKIGTRKEKVEKKEKSKQRKK